jgi:hypothetical protein
MTDVCQLLKETRLARGMSLEEVAQKTYIKLNYLEALEEGRLELLPAPVHTFGYIRLYAKLLGLDGGALVAQFQQQQGVSLMGSGKSIGSGPFTSYRGGNGNGNGNGHRNGNGNGHAAPPVQPVQPEVVREAPPLAPARGPSLNQLFGAAREAAPQESYAADAAQARQIVADAEHQARQLVSGAEAYADDVLSKLEREVENALQIIRNGRSFLASRRDSDA